MKKKKPKESRQPMRIGVSKRGVEGEKEEGGGRASDYILNGNVCMRCKYSFI